MRVVFRRILLTLLLLILVAGGFAAVLVGTPVGRAALFRTAVNFALPKDLDVEWSQLASPTLGSLVVEDLSIGDADGPLLRVDHVTLEWTPARVFSGVLQIERLAAWTVSVSRVPKGDADAPPTPFEIPELPFGIDVAAFSIDRLDLAQPVLGVADSLAVTGKARLIPGMEGPITDGEVHVGRLAAAPARFDASWAYSVADNKLDLNVDLSDPANGTTQAVIGSRADLPVALRLAGTGTLSDWAGEFRFAAGPDATATGTFRINEVDAGIALTAEINAALASMFADERAALLGGDVRIAADALWQEETGTLVINGFELTAPAAVARASGSLVPNAGRYAAMFSADIADAADLSAILGDLRFRDLHLEGNVAFAGSEMSGGATLSLADLAAGELSVASLEATLQPVTGGASAFRLSGRAEGAGISDTKRDIIFMADGLVENGVPVATALTVDSEGTSASFAGRATLDAIAGTVTAEIVDLGAYADLTGQSLAGAFRGSAEVSSASPFTEWSVTVNGTATDLGVGVPQVDPLLAGEATIAGGIALAGARWTVDNVRIATAQLDASASGSLGRAEDTLVVRANLADVRVLDARVSGIASAVATLTGGADAMGISAEITMPEMQARDRRAENVTATFRGTLLDGDFNGPVTLTGEVDDVPVSGTGEIALVDGALSLSEFEVEAAGGMATGSIALAEGQPTGAIAITASDIATLAALAGFDASGSVTGNVTLATDAPPRFDARFERIVFGTFSAGLLVVETLDTAGTERDWTGRIEGSALQAGDDFVVDTVAGTLSGRGDTVGFDLDLRLLGGTATAGGSGEVRMLDGEYRIDLAALSLAKAGETITLTEPAQLAFADGTISTNLLALRSNSGRAVITGSAGEALALDARLDGISLGLVELVAPALNLGGTLRGNVAVTGTAAAPSANFDVSVANLTSPDLASRGLPALDVTARGTFANNTANAAGTVSGIPGLTLSYDGTVPLATGASINVAVNGRADVAALNRFLRASTADVGGQVSLNGTRLTGPLTAPQLSGGFTLSDGRYVDRIAGLAFTNLRGDASVSGNVLTLRGLTGSAANGGTLAASGTVNLGSAGGPTANLTLTAANARIIQSDFVTFDLDGNLSLEGPITRRPRVSGNATVRRLDVNIAASLPTTIAVVDVTHVNAPARLNIPTRTGNSAAGQGTFDAELDLSLTAPGQVFIRGQGLTAELAGQIRLTGTLQRPVTVGAFQLRRGDLSVLGQRFDLTTADLTFAGDIDPLLDITAETEAGDATAVFTIEGQASQPSFTITSRPELPPDEVLARLLFGKATGQLTAGEALSLAQAATQLAGIGGGGGILEEIREKTGLDRLSISTDQQGNAIVDIGRYIGERAYVGVEQGATPGSTRATIDLDITDTIKGRAELGADGDSRIGITVERQY